MHKWIAAFAAILIAGVGGAWTVGSSSAQDARGVIIEEGELVEAVKEGEPGVRPVFRQAQPVQMQYWQPQQQGRPGSWQIVPHDDVVILFNSASGQSFYLEGNDEGLFWKPIPGPGHEPDRPRDREPRRIQPRMPDMPQPPRDWDRPSMEDLQRKLDELRERARESRGEAREKIKKQVKELENALKKRREEMQPRRDRDREGREREWEGREREERERPRRDDADRRERMIDDLEDVMGEIEEKLGDLEDKLDETDNRRDRRALEKAIDELREEAERLERELDELRDRD